MDIAWRVTSSYVGYIFIWYMVEPGADCTRERESFGLVIYSSPHVPNWCLLNKRVNVSYNSRELAVMHGKSERNRDRHSAWLGAWESCAEISRWRHLKFRYAFGRSTSLFWAAPSHPAQKYTTDISDCLSVWLFLLIGLSVSSVTVWVFWVFSGCCAVAFVCRI